MIIAVYTHNGFVVRGKLWQYDYGQVLRIQGIPLPPAVEIHFSLDESGGDSITRVGITTDCATDVVIPNSMLENDDTKSNYYIYAFIYITDEDGGRTEFCIPVCVNARPKIETDLTIDETSQWREVIKTISNLNIKSDENAQLSKSYAVGDTGIRDGEDEDNAKFYSMLAHDVLASLMSKVIEAKTKIDEYVAQKESSLIGDVYFTYFRVVNGELFMYSNIDDLEFIQFYREGSELYYKILETEE